MAGRIAVCAIALGAACGDSAQPPRLVLGTTHTVEDSGLLGALAAAYARDHGTDDRLFVVVAGSGEILAMARRGDVDVILSHSPDAEIAFIAEGRGESRLPVMHNEFVLLGPHADPARAAAAPSPAAALRRIAESRQTFVSRGDDSGTHRKEMALWAAERDSAPRWSGYVEAGSGMADALRLASQRSAYILSDPATFEMLRNSLALTPVHEGNATMHNQYSVIVVSDARNIDGARRFAQWLRGPRAQRLIIGYRRDSAGRALFQPAPIDSVFAPLPPVPE